MTKEELELKFYDMWLVKEIVTKTFEYWKIPGFPHIISIYPGGNGNRIGDCVMIDNLGQIYTPEQAIQFVQDCIQTKL